MTQLTGKDHVVIFDLVLLRFILLCFIHLYAFKRSFDGGFVPIGKKKSVVFRTRDGVQATKDKIVTKMRACMVCRIIASEEQVRRSGELH